jgi:hypothetical protein
MGRWNIEELTARMDEGVIQRLDHYVYRLIDPRNGETFYVGVGKGKTCEPSLGKRYHFKPS